MFWSVPTAPTCSFYHTVVYDKNCRDLFLGQRERQKPIFGPDKFLTACDIREPVIQN